MGSRSGPWCKTISKIQHLFSPVPSPSTGFFKNATPHNGNTALHESCVVGRTFGLHPNVESGAVTASEAILNKGEPAGGQLLRSRLSPAGQTNHGLCLRHATTPTCRRPKPLFHLSVGWMLAKKKQKKTKQKNKTANSYLCRVNNHPPALPGRTKRPQFLFPLFFFFFIN